MAKKKKDKKALLHIDVNITNKFQFGKNNKDKKNDEAKEIEYKGSLSNYKPPKKRGITSTIIGIALIIMLLATMAMTIKQCVVGRDKTAFYNNSETHII